MTKNLPIVCAQSAMLPHLHQGTTTASPPPSTKSAAMSVSP